MHFRFKQCKETLTKCCEFCTVISKSMKQRFIKIFQSRSSYFALTHLVACAPTPAHRVSTTNCPYAVVTTI